MRLRFTPGTVMAQFRTLWVRDFLTRMNAYLTFTGLAALLVGGQGMGGAVSAYLEDKTRHIAVLRCFGGQARLVFASYLAQVLALCLCGTLLGCLAGGAMP